MGRKKRRTRKLNGAGSITKLNGNRSKPWIVRGPAEIQIDGTVKRPIIGYYATSEDAEIALAKYKINPYNLEDRTTTFNDIYELWIDRKKTEVVGDTFRALNNLYLIHFKTKIGYKAIRNIRYGELQEILYKLPKNSSSRAKSIITGVYQLAMKNNIIDKDISILLETSNFKVSTIDRSVFDRELIKKIRNYSNKGTDEVLVKIADLMLILLYSGMRTGEIRQLRTENIFLEQNYIIGGIKTEAGIDRIIPIHPKIKNLIIKYYESDKPFLFYNNRNKEFSEDFFKKKYKLLKEELNFTQTRYSTRHTFITELQRLNITEEKIKKIVGHKTRDITSGVYTHYTPEDLFTIIKKLDYGDW